MLEFFCNFSANLQHGKNCQNWQIAKINQIANQSLQNCLNTRCESRIFNPSQNLNPPKMTLLTWKRKALLIKIYNYMRYFKGCKFCSFTLYWLNMDKLLILIFILILFVVFVYANMSHFVISAHRVTLCL